MVSNYFLLFKTAMSEFRAWRNLGDQYRNKVSVIAELTKGRKKRGLSALEHEALMEMPNVYGFDKVTRQLKEDFGNCRDLILDLTREPSLSCLEISELSSSRSEERRVGKECRSRWSTDH